MRYAVVIEKGEEEYSAYVPDLMGCAATGSDLDQLKQNLHEEVQRHIASMREDGLSIPDPTTLVDYIDIES